LAELAQQASEGFEELIFAPWRSGPSKGRVGGSSDGVLPTRRTHSGTAFTPANGSFRGREASRDGWYRRRAAPWRQYMAISCAWICRASC